MKRASTVTALLAMGLLVAGSFAAAQEAPAASTGGQVTLDLLGRGNVGSSKFDEYRVVPKGVSLPFLSVFRTTSTIDFNLQGSNVGRDDQRYTGWANFSGIGLSFDYNQVPHNMGNNGLVIFNETAPGVWSMSSSLRGAIHDVVDATPTSGRTYPFYTSLLAPTFAAANPLDISSLRKRGDVELDLGGRLPIDLRVTYMRELKTGSRGASGGDILGAVQSTFDVPEPLNEIVQDFGLRAAYRFKMGDVHASFNRNVYNNRAETLIVANPFQAVDEVYRAASGPIPALGGPSSVRMINAPDNEASTGRAGFQLKFKRQTRLTGDVSLASWTQDAAFYPYTINSAILTDTGQPASDVSSLQQRSLNGKINTTTLNFSFSSRPIRGLGLRARYRSYDLSNKTSRWIINGDTSGSPDRSWGVEPPTAEAPYGYATANPYDSTTKRLTASVSYDFKFVTLEGSGRWADLTRTHREATSGNDTGFGLSALVHANDWVDVRAVVDRARRTAEGETIYGFQSDEAERKTLRTGVNIELTPLPNLGVNVGYFRRKVDFPDRPDRVQVTSGAPVPGAQPIPGTPSGLLEASYDSFTGEVDYTPSERVTLSAFYTYEKDASTNQWSTTTGAALNNLLNYVSSDKTNSFGANAQFKIVPDKWTVSLLASRQKVDGLVDVTAREAGTFYTPGRTTIIAAGTGGAQDILDSDDTTLTTALAQLEYAVAANWVVSVGYQYEKYSFSDAFTSGTAMMPQAILIFMKPDEGGYTMNLGFARLSYRF